jgi:general secretion pathway protein E
MPDAREMVGRVLREAVARSASDVHVEPVPGGGYEVRFRIDGLLEAVGAYDAAAGRAVVGRLMVLANLLTYRLDIPQEGRLTVDAAGGADAANTGAANAEGAAAGRLDLRVAIMPTAHGLRAVVRLPAELARGQPRTLEELGLPEAVVAGLRAFAAGDQGMLVVTGPAGSGKTTTLYALLDHIARASAGLSIITLEDPVERHLAGVTQIEVKPFGELTYERALRSILRQDPQVLMLGEIRDAATASLAVQAALSGHRLVCTLHAASPGGAVARMLDMGVEPYQLTSSLFAVVAQRLLRRRVEGAAGATGPAGPDGAAGNYRGRVPVGEIGLVDSAVREAILRRADADALAKAFRSRPGHVTLRGAAEDLVARGLTNPAEVRRVLGNEGEGGDGRSESQ